MYNVITSIDHPVIAVADMDASRSTFERLGFTIPPRGSHVEWGTGNWCIMFPNDYLELRGVIDPTRYTVNLPEFLAERGECLMGVAFGTVGAQETYDQMVAKGLHPKEVRQLTRNFELAEGWVQPRFSLCFPSEPDAPGLMHVVVCEHLTPELIRKPEYLDHANGVTGVISMTGVIEDFDRVEKAQKLFLGPDAVGRTSDGLMLTLPSGQTINLINGAAFERIYGIKDQPQAPFLGVMRLAVQDITKTTQVLKDNGVPSEPAKDGTLRVGPDDTCGMILEFSDSPVVEV